MKRPLLGLCLALVMIASALAHQSTHKSLTIVHPWVHKTEAQQATLHVKIKNSGKGGDRLLSATSPLAAKVAIVDSQGKETNSIAIAGRGEVILKTGGPLIVLSGLKKPLSLRRL